MSKTNFVAELEALIASRAKTASAKTASVGDGADDGLQKTSTGEQAAANAENSSTSSAGNGSPDGGAKTNPVGASLKESESTQTLGAASTDGTEGAKGDLTLGEVAPGSDVTKIASDLRAEAAKIEKLEAAKVASVQGLGRYLVNTIRGDAELAKTAADADDAEVADQATAQLMEQIQSGQLSEEDAMQILDEAVKSGAISQEDVQAAMAELQAAGGAAAPEGGAPAPEGAMPPEAAPVQEEMVNDPALEAKLAHVDVGPNHPMYQTKLASLYAAPMEAGAAFLVKIAEELGMLPSDEPKETPAEEKAEHASLSEEEEKALEAAKRELNLSEEDAKDLMSAPAPEIKSASDRFKAELVLRAAFKK
jgi:hypothetical protein